MRGRGGEGQGGQDGVFGAHLSAARRGYGRGGRAGTRALTGTHIRDANTHADTRDAHSLTLGISLAPSYSRLSKRDRQEGDGHARTHARSHARTHARMHVRTHTHVTGA